jgi:hypothetical protein
MSHKKLSAQPKHSGADVEAALQNLIRKGLVVARRDVNGKVTYFTTDSAPTLGHFDPKSLRRRS